jgi:sec-independent protein translocase protein TatA
MPNIGPLELIVVLIIALLVLGPKRLPDAGRSVGRGIREFKQAISGDDRNATAAGDLPAPVDDTRRAATTSIAERT